MDVTHILAAIDFEIAKIHKAKNTIKELEKATAPAGSADDGEAAPDKRVRAVRRMTPEGRARIAAAQKARWAKKNAAQL